MLDTLLIRNNMYGQVFTDDNTATLIGELGMILHTTDGGTTWKKQVLNDSVYLTAAMNVIDGKDPNMLAMVGDHGMILSTNDGGTNWYRRRIESSDSLRGLSFIDKLNATIVGRAGVILRTSDGGVTWAFQPRNPMNDPLSGIAFPKGDTSLGIGVGYLGTILRTTNGGTRWDTVSSNTTKYLRAVTFTSPTDIIAAGDFGAIVKSTDGGLSWNAISSGTTKQLLGVSFSTPNNVWAVGDSGIIASSTDAGKTWMNYLINKKTHLSGVSFSDSLHGYISSNGSYSMGLFVTTDGGATWDSPDAMYYAACDAVHSPSANTVCVISNMCVHQAEPDYVAMTSHDGGKTWVRGYVGTVPISVYFSDNNYGTVVGVGGQIFHTTDGGLVWKEQKSITSNDLRGVCFGTAKAGTAVGLRGNIVRITTNE